MVGFGIILGFVLYGVIHSLVRSLPPTTRTLANWSYSIYSKWESFRDQGAHFTRDIIVGCPCVVSHQIWSAKVVKYRPIYRRPVEFNVWRPVASKSVGFLLTSPTLHYTRRYMWVHFLRHLSVGSVWLKYLFVKSPAISYIKICSRANFNVWDSVDSSWQEIIIQMPISQINHGLFL